MPVIEDLTEEEKYLFAIFEDRSGLDLAEFTWVDDQNLDGCWRAWDFQWKWFRNDSQKQIDCSARSIGKSLSIKLRGCIFPFAFPGQEMVITAPELVHLEPITGLVENQFYSTKLGRAMLQGGRSSVTHRPFQMNFRNGSRIMGRIPQRDGRGIKGTHPIWLELDEGQDYPEPGWKETIETLKEQEDGARWRVHGVTRGVQDSFYRYTTAPDSPFLVHKYPAMWRPGWSDKERSDKIAMYGGTRDEPDYRRNVHGEHGDATSPLFVMYRLMACVDDEQESEYNTDEYVSYRITDTMIAASQAVPDGVEIMSLIDFPSIHKSRYKTFWCGMDVGFTTSPTEILIWAEELPKKREIDDLKKRGKAYPDDKATRLKLLMRIQLNRIGAPDQARVIAAVIQHYRPQAYSMDSTGAGLPIFQFLQDKEWRDSHGFDETVLTTIKGYGFSEKILVDFDETIIVPDNLTPEELAKANGIWRNVVDYSTDMLRWMVDNKRWWMPWDTDLINEYQFATVAQTKKTVDQYGKKYSKGKDHALDASRMTVLGWKQYALEEMMNAKPEPVGSVLDSFL